MADSNIVYQSLLKGTSRTEIGGTGTYMYANGKIYNLDDYNPDLQGAAAMLVYEKMRSSDGQVAGSLARINLPFMSAKWKVFPPGKEDGKEVTAEGQKMADFIHEWVMEYPILDGDRAGWKDFLRHVLLMLPFGFMAFERVMGVTPDGTTYIKKLGPRLPKSVQNFTVKGGKLQSMTQYAYFPDGYREVTIPANKLVLFCPQREGDNFFGRAILRPAYMHWYSKRELLRFDVIRHERHGVGLPVITIPSGAGDLANQLAEKIGAEIRAHERQFVKLPEDFTLQIMYPTGTASDIIGSAKYHDENISRSMMTEFMSLGATFSGSRSMVQSKSDQLMLVLQGWADYICERVKSEIIVPLIIANFGEQEDYPRIVAEDMDTMSPLVKAKLMQLMVQSGVIEPDDKLEEYSRSGLNLPAKDLKSVRKKIVAAPFGGGDPNRPSGDNSKPVDGGGNGADRLVEQETEVAYDRSIAHVIREQTTKAGHWVAADEQKSGLVPLPMKDRLANNMFMEARAVYKDAHAGEAQQEDLIKIQEVAQALAQRTTIKIMHEAMRGGKINEDEVKLEMQWLLKYASDVAVERGAD